jgi:plasmid stabilization system protein ParE
MGAPAMRVVYSTRAIQDLQRIDAHIAHYTTPGHAYHAYEVLADLRQQTVALADHPGLGRPGQRRGTRFLVMRVGLHTYRCTYRVQRDRVLILTVRDTRQAGS